MGKNPDKLRDCYENCFKIVKEKGLRSVAFCCISTGIYGYPNRDAAHVALSATRHFLERNHKDIDRVIFCTFLAQDFNIYEELMASTYFPCSDIPDIPDDDQLATKTSSIPPPPPPPPPPSHSTATVNDEATESSETVNNNVDESAASSTEVVASGLNDIACKEGDTGSDEAVVSDGDWETSPDVDLETKSENGGSQDLMDVGSQDVLPDNQEVASSVNVRAGTAADSMEFGSQPED